MTNRAAVRLSKRPVLSDEEIQLDLKERLKPGPAVNHYIPKPRYGRYGGKIGRPTRKEALAKKLAAKPLSFDEFVLHVSHEASKPGANSAIMSVYKELLKLKAIMEKESDYRITADEMARRNLQAERELKEAGYIEKEIENNEQP